MAKGYWIAFVTITDPERYAGYQAIAPEAFARFGARFLVRGGAADTLEGPAYQRHVVIEFDSREDALACYNSPEYTAARARRDNACEVTVVVVDGMDTGPSAP